MSVTDWSPQPSGNAVADRSIPARDGMAGREFPEAIRGLMAKTAALALDQGGALISEGISDAYDLFTNSGFAEIKPGVSLTFRAHRDNTGSTLLNVDGSGPRRWLDVDGADFPAGAVKAGFFYSVVCVESAGAPPAWRTVGATSTAVGKHIDDLGVLLSDNIRTQGISRAEIAQITIPTISFTVSGYSAAGDAGYGAPYVLADASAPAAIRDRSGKWYGVNRNVAEVRPEWFGAVPWLGIPALLVDSTDGANAAEAFASSVGAPVRFSRGVYWNRGLTKRSRSDWIGAGVGRTILRLLPNTVARAVVSGLNAYALRGGSSVTEGVFEFEISKLSIDGNRQNGGRSDGLALYGAVFKVSEYEILNCSNVGQWTEFPFGGIPTAQKNVQSQFYNGYVHENYNGIEYGGPNDSEFYSVYSYLNDGEFNLHTYGAGSGKFTSCHTWCDSILGPQVSAGVILSSPGNILIGCALEGAKREQVWVRGNNQTFIGCYVFYNQLAVAGRSVAGLRLGDDGNGVVALSGRVGIFAPNEMISFPGGKKARVVEQVGELLRFILAPGGDVFPVNKDIVGQTIVGQTSGATATIGLVTIETRGYAEVQGVRFTGKIQNCDTALQLSQDRGYHVLDIDGFTTRQGASGLSGAQYLLNGSPTSDIKLAIQSVTDGTNPAPAPIPAFHQIVARADFYGGLRVRVGSLSSGVENPVANLDTAVLRYFREASATGGIFIEGWSTGILRQTLERQTGGYKEWAMNAFGTDQITLTSNGVKMFTLSYANNAAAVGAGLPSGVVYTRPDGTLAVRV